MWCFFAKLRMRAAHAQRSMARVARMRLLLLIPAFVLLIGLLSSTPKAVTTRPAQTSSAQKAWVPFFAAFRVAVKKRDRVALKEMMRRDFFYTLGHHASDQRDAAFNYWDGEKSRGWKAFDRVLAKGAVPTTDKEFSSTPGELQGPMRVAPPAATKPSAFRRNLIDWYAVFEFTDDRWYCITFIECCD